MDAAEAVAFNKDQRIVIIGQRITPEIRQTALFLCSKGVRVTCVEFTFFQTDGEGDHLLSQETVVGKEVDKLTPSSSDSLPVVTEEAFLASCDENGRAVYSRILEWARKKSVYVRWATRGFSLNADLSGTYVGFLWGYLPFSVFKQAVYTALRDPRFMGKTAVPKDVIQALWKQAEATGLFDQPGRGRRDLRCQITRKLTEAEVGSLVAWCESVEQAIRQYGLKQ